MREDVLFAWIDGFQIIKVQSPGFSFAFKIITEEQFGLAIETIRQNVKARALT